MTSTWIQSEEVPKGTNEFECQRLIVTTEGEHGNYSLLAMTLIKEQKLIILQYNEKAIKYAKEYFHSNSMRHKKNIQN